MLSKSTAQILIDNKNLGYTHAGPDDNGKYSGWILRADGSPVLITDSIFDSGDQASDHLIKLRNQLKLASNLGQLNED